MSIKQIRFLANKQFSVEALQKGRSGGLWHHGFFAKNVPNQGLP
jgi:hypothetical protein